MQDLSRRNALKLAVASGFAAALSKAVPSAYGADLDSSAKPIRLGFIGVGDRGTGLLNVALNFPNL